LTQRKHANRTDEGLLLKIADPVRFKGIGSRCYGAADGEGCGTLGALSNDTNGAPHVATF